MEWNNVKSHIFKVSKLLIKVGISVGALYFVTTKVDMVSLMATMANISYTLIIIAFLLLLSAIVFAAMRLDTLFKAMPLHVTHLTNFKLYWLGLFYNLFLPGGVGGDGYKIFLINKYHKKPVKSLIGVILTDRLSGLGVIVIYLLLLLYAVPIKHLPFVNFSALLVPVVLFGFWLFIYLFNRTLISKFWKVIGWSLLSQFMQILVAYTILYAIGEVEHGDALQYLFLFLVSSITASIPISLGGIGLREMTLMYGATYLGLNVEQAVALSFIFYILSLSVSLPGIIFTFDTSKLLEKEETLLTDEEADAELV